MKFKDFLLNEYRYCPGEENEEYDPFEDYYSEIIDQLHTLDPAFKVTSLGWTDDGNINVGVTRYLKGKPSPNEVNYVFNTDRMSFEDEEDEEYDPFEDYYSEIIDQLHTLDPAFKVTSLGWTDDGNINVGVTRYLKGKPSPNEVNYVFNTDRMSFEDEEDEEYDHLRDRGMIRREPRPFTGHGGPRQPVQTPRERYEELVSKYGKPEIKNHGPWMWYVWTQEDGNKIRLKVSSVKDGKKNEGISNHRS